MSEPVFTMGATGRMGGAITRLLAARGVPVRAAARATERYQAVDGVQPVTFDLLDPTTWRPALDGCGSMFIMWPPGTSTTDVFGFVDVAIELGVQRAAFLSVLGADSMTFLPHAKIEQHLQQSSLSVVLLRSGYFMQNFSTMHRDDIRHRDEIALPTGRGRISMVDVSDVAEAAVVALVERKGSLAWDLTGPAALRTADVAGTLTDVLGRPIADRQPSILRFYLDQTRRGTPRGLALFMIAEYTHARLGYAGRLGDGVQETLGRPPTSFRDFAEREAACWRREDAGEQPPLAPPG